MAKRKPDGCDNSQTMDKFSYRQDDTTKEWYRAVCDEVAHDKLDTIAANIGDNFCTKVAAETISALKLVKLDNPTDVSVASIDTCPNATVLGVARIAGTTGANVEIAQSGKLYDSSFNFPVNAPLFLDATGSITDTAPTTGFLTQIGTSGGPGLININITDPVEL